MPLRLPMRVLAGCLLGSAATTAMTEPQPPGAGIYTCIDAKGRRLTSDRPILECIDREQKELSSTGTVRRTLGPSLTASERAELEERERKAAEERQRQVDTKRVQRALVARYPNQAAHDAERESALKTLQDTIAAGNRRLADLQEQHRKLLGETEFYRSPAQWPPALKRQIEENQQQIAGQQRFLAAQEEEKSRINSSFDEELARLRQLWAQPAASTASTPVRR